jgi:hypothetical protein
VLRYCHGVSVMSRQTVIRYLQAKEPRIWFAQPARRR